MTPRLLPCSTCGRHGFATELACPFCHAARARAVATAVTLGAGLSLLACHTEATTTSAQPTSSASAAPSTSASAAPSASGTTAEGADGGGLGALSGISALREQAAVYGPPPGLREGPSGDVTVTPKSAAPIADLDKTVGALRPRLRALYMRELKIDPSEAGHVTLVASVAADGTVTAVKASEVAGLSPGLVANFTHVVEATLFHAPGHPTTLTLPIVCKRTEPTKAPTPTTAP